MRAALVTKTTAELLLFFIFEILSGDVVSIFFFMNDGSCIIVEQLGAQMLTIMLDGSKQGEMKNCIKTHGMRSLANGKEHIPSVLCFGVTTLNADWEFLSGDINMLAVDTLSPFDFT